MVLPAATSEAHIYNPARGESSKDGRTERTWKESEVLSGGVREGFTEEEEQHLRWNLQGKGDGLVMGTDEWDGKNRGREGQHEPQNNTGRKQDRK